jgi:hypothetical protein
MTEFIPNNSILEEYFIKDASIVSRQIADEYILVPICQSADEVEHIFTLNIAAARIWELLDGEHSLREVRDTLVSEFAVDTDKAQADLLVFIEKLESIGAVNQV